MEKNTENRMMKFLGAWVLGGLLLGASGAQAVPLSTKVWSPFFDMNVTQAAYFPAGGQVFEGAQVNAAMGWNVKQGPRNSILALYNMRFTGAGFQFPDTKEFSSKDLLHHFSLEYRWMTGEKARLRPGIVYGTDFTRTAAGEIWGTGLYDNRYLGGQLAWDLPFRMGGKDALFTAQWLLRNVKFPNYTDLLREFQGSASNVELAGGLKDQLFNELGVRLAWNHMTCGLKFNLLNFTNERVVESNGTYGGTKQKDSNFEAALGWEGRLGIFDAMPELAFTGHASNQNFLLFESITDSLPEFRANYYGYGEWRLDLPLVCPMSKTSKWAWLLGANYRYRGYADRPIRNAENQFLKEIQHNGMFTLNTGWRKRINDISAWTLMWTFVHANSNNRFERYLPYNYYGNSLSLGYQLTY